MISQANHPRPLNGNDSFWMEQALLLAHQAKAIDEIPVGAVVVLADRIIGRGHNASIITQDPTAHAEIMALRDAARTVGNYRLNDAALYVTLEPCMMCAGAMVHARVKRLVYGASDPKAGVIESQECVLNKCFLNHRIDYTGGVLAEPCGELLSLFFKERR